MSDVKRYRMFHDYIADCHCEIDEHADGEYVSLSDYDALAAERDALRAELASKTAEQQHLWEKYHIESDESFTECIERNIDGWKQRVLKHEAELEAVRRDAERFADTLHAHRAHPDYEYKTTTCGRKAYYGEPQLEAEGWVYNEFGGDPHSSWDRFEYHENHYWRRKKPEIDAAMKEQKP